MAGRGGYGYGYGKGAYGGYYSYADYYNAPDPIDAKKGPAQRVAEVSGQIYIPQKSPGRKFAEGLGRVLKVVLAALAVLVIAALVAYFLDKAMGWGMLQSLVAGVQ
jgi:hypothetical protein